VTWVLIGSALETDPWDGKRNTSHGSGLEANDKYEGPVGGSQELLPRGKHLGEACYFRGGSLAL